MRDALGNAVLHRMMHRGRLYAAQHLAEGEIEAAELRLSGMLIGVVVGIVIVPLASSQIIFGVPDSVREGALLRGEQQENASELQ